MYNELMEKKSLKKRIFEIIQIGNTSDIPSRAFDLVLVSMIVLNILTLFLETFDELASWSQVFEAVEAVTILFFCVEYALRIWTAELSLLKSISLNRNRISTGHCFPGTV